MYISYIIGKAVISAFPMKTSLKIHPYTYTKVCGHPVKLVDLAISGTLIADRCIKIEHTAMQSPLTNIGSRMALQKSSVTFNVASS